MNAGKLNPSVRRVVAFIGGGFLLMTLFAGCVTRSARSDPSGGASNVTAPANELGRAGMPPFEGCRGEDDPAFVAGLKASWMREPTTPPVVLRSVNDAFARDDGRVLVVTLNDDNRVDAKVGEEVAITKEIWVTLSPDLQVACAKRAMANTSTSTRLHQLVGVPTQKNYNRVTAYWVAPDAIFRPCTDTSPLDSACDAPPQAWLVDKSGTPRCYPFTGTGYTWDWGAAAPGLSEFQLHKSEALRARAHPRPKAIVHCVYADLEHFCDSDRRPLDCDADRGGP